MTRQLAARSPVRAALLVAIARLERTLTRARQQATAAMDTAMQQPAREALQATAARLDRANRREYETRPAGERLHECPQCDGEGIITLTVARPHAHKFGEYVDCDELERCPTCNGYGVIT